MLLQISEIVVHPRQRNIEMGSVRELADSISMLGLLNPITVDHNHILIAGLHRLEAAKLLNWTEIECSITSLEGLRAEMAELDENFVRAKLSQIELSNLLMRRKEIYETLHPEVKHGGDRKSEKIKTAKSRFDSVKPFSEDTADKWGVDKRTVERQVQIAKNLTPEAKGILLASDAKLTKKDALKLSRLEPEQQKEAATQLVAGEIRSMGEYQPPAASSEAEEAPHSALEQIIADLKNHDKESGYTPDTLLADIDGLVNRFQQEFAWYSEPHCTVVFPRMSRKQFEFVKQRFESISAAMEGLLNQMERKMKNEQPKKAPSA